MTDAPTSAADVPSPRGYTLTVPDTATAPLAELPQSLIQNVSVLLTIATKTLRSRPPAPVDGCLNRGTCRLDKPTSPCCLLCALTDAFARRLPAGASTHYAADLAQAAAVAKQLAVDTIEANPHHGGEVFVLTHLADLVRTEGFEQRVAENTAAAFDPPTLENPS